MNPALGAPARKFRVRVTSVSLAGPALLELPPVPPPLLPPEEPEAQEVSASVAAARRAPVSRASRGLFARVLCRMIWFLSFLGVVMGSMPGVLPGGDKPLDELDGVGEDEAEEAEDDQHR